ncbi:PLP-dependent aminotransferase family protein [Deinococcus frigens]|uniref:MocR-like pyridoxine biosynthesis transcription factor PdxR n=1 Tax=Deinococcus frigens TaxID=249403 RepID=UPI000A557478
MARTLRDAVTGGLLPEGTRLPGHRRLAGALGVSRNTLVDAVAGLQAEGYLRVQGRSGTVVCLPTPLPEAPQPLTDLPLSAWATRALAGGVHDAEGEYAVDFRVGQPVPELYPEAAWTAALARQAGRLGRRTEGGQVSDPLGPLETRRALSAYLNAARGARVTPEMVMLTGGTQSALDALARVFLESGRVAAVEDPTYPGARAALAATGAAVVPVAVDRDGLQPRLLPPQATLLYLTPGCQYPTGVTLGAVRRAELVAWARRGNAFILEDDYAADLHHTGRPLPVMQGLAPDRVILLGSFSKSLAPATRSGFLAAPPPVLRVLARTRPLTDRAPGTLDALALADVLDSGAYGRHLRRARQLLAHRQEVLLQVLGEWLPDWTPWGVASGLHVYVHLPEGLTGAQAVGAAARRGVALSPVTPLSALGAQAAVLLAFAHLSPDTIRQGIRRLASSP